MCSELIQGHNTIFQGPRDSRLTAEPARRSGSCREDRDAENEEKDAEPTKKELEGSRCPVGAEDK
jgi:hypothetical protein